MAGNSEKQLFPIPREPIEVDKDGEGQGIFYFHEPGDFLKGILFGIHKRQTIHYEFVTYRMRLWEGRQNGVDLLIKDDQLVEFPANMKMRRIIEDHELIGSLVRIVFRGKKGRYKKYEVFKDTGTFYESEEQKHGRFRKRQKIRKHKPAAAIA